MNLFNLKAILSIDDTKFKQGVESARKGIDGIGDSKAFQKLDGFIKKSAIAVGALGAVVAKMGIQYNASLQSSTVAWTTLLGTQDKAKSMMKDIEQYAAKTPFTKMGVDTMAKQLHNAGFEGDNLFAQLTKFGDIGGAFGIQEDSLKEMVRQFATVNQATIAYTEDLNILQDRGVPIYKALAEVTGKSVAEVKKMASEGKISADIYNKAIDSIASKTTGAMEGQSKTFQGMTSTLKDNLGMIAGKLLEPLFNKLLEVMPKILELVDGVNSKMTEGQSFMSALKESIEETFGANALTNFNLIKDAIIGIVAVWATLKSIMVINDVVSGIKEFKTNVIDLGIGIDKMANRLGLAEKATKLYTATMKLMDLAFKATSIGWIVLGITALVAGFILLWNNCEGFRNFWIELWEVVKTKAVDAWEAISEFFTETIPETFNKIIDFFKDNWQGILLFLINPFAGAFKLLYDNCDGFKEFIDGFVEDVGNFFKEGWEAVVTFFTESIPNFVNDVLQWLGELPGKIWAFINEAPAKIGEGIGAILGYIYTLFVTWWEGFVTFWTEMVPNLIIAIAEWFSELPGKIWTWLVQVITDFGVFMADLWNDMTTGIGNLITGIGEWFAQLPTKVYTWLLYTWDRFKSWCSDMWNTASEKISALVEGVGNWFSEMPAKVWKWLVDTWNKLVQWGSDMVASAKESAKEVFNAIVDKIKEIPHQMLEIGKNIVKGIWDGITGMAGWLKEKIGDFAGGIVKGFKGALGIHSPSRVMKKEVGKYTAQGVGVGFIEEMEDVNKQIEDSMKDTISSARVPIPYYKQDDFKESLKTMFTVDFKMDIDGKEFVRKTVAPHQEELEDYNRMTTTAFSY